MKGEITGWPRGASETGTRTTAARRKTADQARGGWVQYHRDQVSRNVEGGEYRARRADQEGIDDKSAEWSGADSEETEGSATEEEATTAGG